MDILEESFIFLLDDWMAISVVSSSFSSDDQAPITVLPPDNESNFSYTPEDTSVRESRIPDQNITSIQEQYTTTSSNSDNQRLDNLHPEDQPTVVEHVEKPIEDISESIPNMYIKADVANTVIDVPDDVAIFSQEPKEEVEGFDMDDLLNQETSISQKVSEESQAKISPEIVQPKYTESVPVVVVDSPVQETAMTNTTSLETTPAPIQTQTQAPVIAPKRSLTKSLAFVAASLSAIVVLGFVVKTMFPVGLGGNHAAIDAQPDTIITEDVVVDTMIADDILGEEHAAAEEQSQQEVIKEELATYIHLGQSYYELGKDNKDRNMVRYALYIEKKSQDLMDLLASDPDMDTKDIVVYFAQFDDYLKTIREREAELPMPIVVESDSVVSELDDENTGEMASNNNSNNLGSLLQNPGVDALNSQGSTDNFPSELTELFNR